MEHYAKGSVIGKGAYGIVYKAECRETGREFALKYHTFGLEESTVRELSCLSALRGHPHVIQIHDCFLDQGTVVMLMPYVPYTLALAIHNGRGQDLDGIPLSFVAHFSTQVASALSHMHGLNIVHRDLTPFNVLLTEELTVQVADMGLSRNSSLWMSPGMVTEQYRAPEVSDHGCAEYTCAIDTWSLGVMIAEAMEGHVLFPPCISKSGKRISTYWVIRETLCPSDHPDAPRVSLGPALVMPKAMGCEIVKGLVLRLLAFRAEQRLLAHELLLDTEWMRLARMTEDDRLVVKGHIRSQAENQH
ncbi:hypothetical protein KUCAC02_025116 [Chaenocephalus aceratus]|nr:hypothetical protein KUCAC02_025116 [Chaenocephalus aceratus]